MATKVIMPALGMAQETGKLIAWLRKEGERVNKGEPLMEIETDKATVEIEATASGTLGGILAREGQEIPVGQTIAWLLESGEKPPVEMPTFEKDGTMDVQQPRTAVTASPVAQKIADKHGIDLNLVKPDGGRIQKVDVLAYLHQQKATLEATRLIPASPKARRLAAERGLDLANLQGSGPAGAVLAADVLAAELVTPVTSTIPVSTFWQRMAERVTQSWVTTPHFYLLREVNASRMMAWRNQMKQRGGDSVTYTDLLVKLVAVALRNHPRINAAWHDGHIVLSENINIGLAIAVEAGLVVPVIHNADQLGLSQIAEQRLGLIKLAQDGKLRLEDLQNGTFTISNLGMYGIDIFNAILNPPQAAILAVGRIADQVVPIHGQPAVQPMMVLSLSCDHRVVDGARGAQFLETLANYIEEPLLLLE